MKKSIIFVIFVAFLVLLPLSSVRASEKISHPFENSVLLMLSSQMRLDGEVESANAGNGHLLSVSFKQLAGQNMNEIDILIQLYVDQITQLRQSGKHTPELEERLVNSFEAKIDELRERSAALVEVRKSGRRGGFFGGLGRIFKAVGRGTGWLMGRAMEGSGKVVQFAIEEVAPQVLKEAVLGGTPLNAALVRVVARDLLIKRVEGAIIRQQEQRAQVVLEEEEDDDIDLVDSLETKSAIEESEETQAALEESESTPSPQGVLIYEFTQDDAVDLSHEYPYSEWWGMGDVCCIPTACVADSFSVHLEFDLEAMTVSGWMTGSGQQILPTLIEGISNDYDVQSSFRITFSDIPLVPGNNPVAWTFTGEGLSTVSYGGTVRCSIIDPEHQSLGWQDYEVRDEISLADHPTHIAGIVYIPAESRGLRIETSIDPVDEFTSFFRMTVNKTIDLPAP